MTIRATHLPPKSKVDLLEALQDDFDDLVQRCRKDARSIGEADARTGEAERIATALRRVFRG